MQNIADDLRETYPYYANLGRMDRTATPPRSATYATRIRCSFGSALTTLPSSMEGIAGAKWVAVVTVWGVHQRPFPGDTLKDIRLARTGALVMETLNVNDVHPHPLENTYILLLVESR